MYHPFLGNQPGYQFCGGHVECGVANFHLIGRPEVIQKSFDLVCRAFLNG